MTMKGWMELLAAWDKRILSILREDHGKGKYEGYADILRLLEKQTLGYPPATGSEIAEAEARLGLLLPESYKNFLRVSNGWDQLGIGPDFQVGLIFPANGVDFFYKQDPYLFSAESGTPMNSNSFCMESEDRNSVIDFAEENYTIDKLEKKIAVSEAGEHQYFLYPEVIRKDAEWEAWRCAESDAIYYRYGSFWDLMNAEFKRLLF